jgi:Ca2+-binding RTX toxin-like protein
VIRSFFPEDPLVLEQWHLFRLGNIQRIWGEYTGLGVHVGIYDEGVQATHPDLAVAYDPSRHVVIAGRVFDGAPVEWDTGHGTSVAGLIAAAANGIGTVGVAFGARITGVNIGDSASDLFLNAEPATGFVAALAQSTRFDVVNHSWGFFPNFDDVQNPDIAGSFASLILGAWAEAAATGRDGLGTIVVKSAGNREMNTQAEGLNPSRYTVTVAAVNEAGFAASYSNHGFSILVAAPGGDLPEVGGLGIVTTDLLGAEGYNRRDDLLGDHDQTDDFAGTSAAAPIVSGAVALMLEANPGLGWRDVQNILAASATHVGSAFTATAPEAGRENSLWQFNRADGWNGGGMHVHENYGYGELNIYNAVRMAEVWSLFTPAQTSANERRASTGPQNGNMHIADAAESDVTFRLSRAVEIEHVSLTITFTHGRMLDLDLFITSPEGTRLRLLDGTAGWDGAAASGLTWTFGIDALRGERSDGTWTLGFIDMAAGYDGTLTRFALTAYGRAVQVNDVYHFTDEFAALAALQPDRRMIADTDGGTDWINAAAVSTGSLINLNENAFSSIGGGSLRITGVIENAIGGDGDDVLIGNAAANELRGMRGADTMLGGLGDDTYVVDDAGDVTVELAGGGHDRVIASVNWTLAAQIERLSLGGTRDLDGTGNALANRLDGNAGANRLDGGAGADTLIGLEGQDTLIGGAGADRLEGGAGADHMAGGADNDTYLVDDAGDVVVELAGEGNDRVFASVSHTLADGVERLSLTGSAGLDGTGNALANQMEGNAGDNRLEGGDGHDTLNGLEGQDTLVGGSGADRLDGGRGADSLIGGAGADRFVFRGVAEAAGDIIADFSAAQGDRIDLRPIDADPGLAGDQLFHWIGATSFAGLPGQLRFAGGTLEGDTDGNGAADFQISLAGVMSLSATNLWL